ncbi:MAG TPA: magnesium transporter, partial [archaeon]|nr:magnesium transporter [archaeon]
SAVLGTVAYFANLYFFGVNNISIIFIALFAGIFSNIIEIPITIFTTFWLFRHGHDPNNIMGPYVTTIGDIVSILSLLIAIVII